MKKVTFDRLQEVSIQALGVASFGVDLFSEETIAASIRRAASFHCPCSASRIIESVLRAYQGLSDREPSLKERIEDIFEAMVAHGDLQEHVAFHEQNDSKALLVYGSPPSFVRRASGGAILLGIGPDGKSLLPEDLEERLEVSNHVRRIPGSTGLDVVQMLINVGMKELDQKHWIKVPKKLSSEEFVETANQLLEAHSHPGQISAGQLLDHSRSIRYYRGRWVEQKAQTGNYIYRRKQSYGSDIWCYAKLVSGVVTRLLDLPLPSSSWRGCDEAWHHQSAIDFQLDHPQEYRVRAGSERRVILEFFSPIPSWARRRLDAIAEPIPPSGSLFSYALDEMELEEEKMFLKEMLWLKQANN